MATLPAAAAITLVFCAPGYPGETGDAQPYLDQFAQVVAAAAGWPRGSLTAVYDPSESGGLARLESPGAGLAFVPYPFFVAHAEQLQLAPLVAADVAGTGSRERWQLIARRGRVPGPASLAGFTLVSTAGYARDFITRAALPSWPLPRDVRIEASGQVLSALRRAAAGEPVAVLLDHTGTAALASLPFAGELEAVVQSPELPVAVLAVVRSRVPAARARSLRAALLGLAHGPDNAELLASMRLKGFVPAELPGRTAEP
ncbi:MAG TPA: PhnD/SsuA/transferrin family substrate-binding protein [Steroidobacteraceae bacterium]|nr:PhnD/SsuA/transferrin family substrate-binding protein [Steroidobacteraceae bacterium]